LISIENLFCDQIFSGYGAVNEGGQGRGDRCRRSQAAHGLGMLPNNVRYLGQSGGYMLTESFTARDPERKFATDAETQRMR
jgi:hypothetical protein